MNALECRTLKVKAWNAMSFDWELWQDRFYTCYYYLLRDGKVVKEGHDKKELLSLGWY